MTYKNLVTENASLGHKSNRAMETVNYNPVTGLTDKVPSVTLDKALSTTSTNPVENRAIAESVIECINGISRNRYAIEQAGNEISNVNTRIDINVTAIEKNAQDIQTVDDKVSANTSAIEQNTINIQKNTDAIEQIDTDIGDLSEVIATVRRHSVEIVELKNTSDEHTNDIAENTSAIIHEATRASAAEAANATAINNEVTRATTAEGNNATAISDEVTRATNAEAALQQAINKLIPVGTVVDYWGTTDPDDWFVCDGRDTTGTDDELETNYPTLYAMLGNSNVLPDLRECVTVGAGKNETSIFDSTETNPATGTAGTQAHDVYIIGEFKDDQFQGHQHEQYQATSDSKANWNNSYRISGWTWRDTQKIKDMADMTAARWGTTTHGKQVGCNKIIKAR